MTRSRPSVFYSILVLSLLIACPCCSLSFAEDQSSSGTERESDEESSKRLREIVVEGRTENLVGIAESASQGRVGQEEFRKRPFLRTGELLETVPGLIVTQHSGDGKANQYFLRGFNLDHGTDFRTTVDGMPVNNPTHAHGQGYTDLNFIIPELVSSIDYKKGVYYAEEGDFSSAGAANLHLYETLPQGIAQLTYGEYDYVRAVTAKSSKLGLGTLTYGGEIGYYDGPWELSQNANKYSGMIRYAQGDKANGFNLTFLGYRNTWDSTDQIPQRLVDSGTLSPFGNLDSTAGGRTSRYSLSGEWRKESGNNSYKANAYAIYYGLNLFSNFTYFLDNPAQGDQFEQVDRRGIFGGEFTYKNIAQVFEHESATTFGVQVRNDVIPTVALKKTQQRREISTVRDDDVYEGTIGVYAKNETEWTEKFRSNVGLRGDVFNFHVDSDREENSGDEIAGKISPKAGFVVGPYEDTEMYANAGLGFHSNDARGTTIKVDPNTGESVSSVDPLVLSRGAEFGFRSSTVKNLNSTLSFWMLDLSSELLFVGDAGLTEPNRGSRRMGIEFSNFYKPLPWLTLDADYSVSRARFREDDGTGTQIPGSIENVLTSGATAEFENGFFVGARLRFFGPRPLIEDNSVRSSSTTVVNSRVGYSFQKNLTFTLDCLNLLDSGDHDIDYFYTSRLQGESTAGVDDVHFHPVEPREFRGTITWKF